MSCPQETESLNRDRAAFKVRFGAIGRVFALAVSAWTSLVPAYASSGPWVEHPQVRARLVSPWTIAPSVGDVQMGVEFQLSPGWHAYWKNPGDAGFPPRFTWSSRPAGATFRVLWPAPHRYVLPGELQSLGYSDRVVYPVRARFTSGPPTQATIETEANYLVCSDSCIPYRDRLKIDLRTGPQPRADVDAARDYEQWLKRVPREASAEASPSPLSLTVNGTTLVVHISKTATAAGTPEIFFASHPLFDIGIPQASPGDPLDFSVPIRKRDRTRPLPPSTTFEWTLTSSKGDAIVQAVEGSSSVDLSDFASPEVTRRPN